VEIACYVYEKSGNPDKADEAMEALKGCIVRTLSTFPRLGRPAAEFGPGQRKLVCQDFTIVYRIEKELIFIVTIFRENLP
jgi:plasmid stabilization system protein ParE